MLRYETVRHLASGYGCWFVHTSSCQLSVASVFIPFPSQRGIEEGILAQRVRIQVAPPPLFPPLVSLSIQRGRSILKLMAFCEAHGSPRYLIMCIFFSSLRSWAWVQGASFLSLPPFLLFVFLFLCSIVCQRSRELGSQSLSCAGDHVPRQGMPAVC